MIATMVIVAQSSAMTKARRRDVRASASGDRVFRGFIGIGPPTRFGPVQDL